MFLMSQARNQPRLFDNIRPVTWGCFLDEGNTTAGVIKVRIGPRDLEQLDLTCDPKLFVIWVLFGCVLFLVFF